MLVKDISWDSNTELPKNLIVNIPSNEEDIEEYIRNEISEMTGFCHFGFNYEILEN